MQKPDPIREDDLPGAFNRPKSWLWLCLFGALLLGAIVLAVALLGDVGAVR